MATVLHLAVRLAASVARAALAGARVRVLTEEALEDLLAAETAAALLAGRRLAEQEAAVYGQRAVGETRTLPGRFRTLTNGATLHAIPRGRL